MDDLFTGVNIPAGPAAPVLVGRATRRRRQSAAAVAGVLASVVTLAVVATVWAAPSPIDLATGPATAAVHRDTRDGAWQWVRDESIVGRDGSTSGFAASWNPGASTLVIALGGGQPCVDQPTCERSVSGFDAGDLENAIRSGSGDLGGLTPAQLNREGGPFEGMNLIWLPQVTGDMHLGTKTDAEVPGLSGPQQFVGQRNVAAMLARLKKAAGLRGTRRVVLIGAGTGGFGALGNYRLVHDAFGDADVALLVDSAPWFHPGDVLMRCVANNWISLWGIRQPPDWPDELDTGASALGDVYSYLALAYPEADFGFSISTDDPRTRSLYADGTSRCRGQDGSDAASYAAAVGGLGAELSGLAPWQVVIRKDPGRPLENLLSGDRGPGWGETRDLVSQILDPAP